MEPFPEELFTIGGDPRAIAESGAGFGRYATTLGEVLAGVATATAPSWTGVEGDLYRARLAEFPRYLGAAQQAFGEVASVLSGFSVEVDHAQRAMSAERAAARVTWARLQSVPMPHGRPLPLASPAPPYTLGRGAPDHPGGVTLDAEFEEQLRRVAALRSQVDRAALAAQARIRAVTYAPVAPVPVGERRDCALLADSATYAPPRLRPPEGTPYTDTRKVEASAEAGTNGSGQADFSLTEQVRPDGRVAVTLLVGRGAVFGTGVGATVRLMLDDDSWGVSASASAETSTHDRRGVVLLLSPQEAARLRAGDPRVLWDGFRPRRPDGFVTEKELRGEAGADALLHGYRPGRPPWGVDASAEVSARNVQTTRSMSDGTTVRTVTSDLRGAVEGGGALSALPLAPRPGPSWHGAGAAGVRGTVEVTEKGGRLTHLTFRIRERAHGEIEENGTETRKDGHCVEWDYTIPVESLSPAAVTALRKGPAAFLNDPRVRQRVLADATVTRKQITVDSSTSGAVVDAEFILKGSGEASMTKTTETVTRAEYWDGTRMVLLPGR